MTITFTMTAGDLVERAMQARRCLGLGRIPTAAEGEYGLQRLDQLLKALAVDGVNPWTDEEGTATITANVAEVELAPRPVDVMAATLAVSATYERPMDRWETGTYDDLPNKAQTGEPMAFTLRVTPTAVFMRVWPVPTTNKTVNYRYVRVIEDVEASTPLDVPQSWIEGIEKMLAARLDAFANGNPELMDLAAYHERRLYDQSRPESYTIQSGIYA